MSTETITVESVIETLNRFLRTDPKACAAFIETEIPCNKSLADDPSIRVRSKGDNTYRVRLLGVINGILGPIQHGKFAGWGPICVVMEEDGSYSRFAKTEETVVLPLKGVGEDVE